MTDDQKASVVPGSTGCECRAKYSPDQDGTMPSIAVCPRATECAQTWNVRQTARHLGVHENTVRAYARSGRLSVAIQLNDRGHRRFRQVDVEALRQEMTR